MIISRKEIKLNDLKDDKSSKSLLYLAVETGNEEIVRSLLSNQNIDVNLRGKTISHDKTPLFHAVEIEMLISCDINSISYLRQNTKNVKESENRTALYEAVIKNNLDIVKLLLSNDNIDINIEIKIKGKRIQNNECESTYKGNDTVLGLAYRLNNHSIIKLLQAKCIDSEKKIIHYEHCYDNKHKKITPLN